MNVKLNAKAEAVGTDFTGIAVGPVGHVAVGTSLCGIATVVGAELEICAIDGCAADTLAIGAYAMSIAV